MGMKDGNKLWFLLILKTGCKGTIIKLKGIKNVVNRMHLKSQKCG